MNLTMSPCEGVPTGPSIEIVYDLFKEHTGAAVLQYLLVKVYAIMPYLQCMFVQSDF